MKKAVIIGLGLIGGSFALELKKRLQYTVVGIDKNPQHLQEALALGIISEAINYSQIADADLVLVAVPVNRIAQVVNEVLDHVGENTLVMDVGSVKESIFTAASLSQRTLWQVPNTLAHRLPYMTFLMAR